METLDQLREFEDSCLKPRVTGQVIVRNPNKDKHKPAGVWNGTQSYYYMPLITEAYYRAQGKDVPQEILNMSGRITLLKRKPNFDYIAPPEYYTNEGYEKLVQAIIAYLKDGNLGKLEIEYKNDRKPTENSPGHIAGNRQQDILGGAGIEFIVESMIQIHFDKLEFK